MIKPMATATAVLMSLTLVLVAGGATLAGGRPLSTDLTGAQELAPADPDGSGTAQLRLNHGQGEICYRLDVAGIDPAVAAHIHHAPAGVNGPVVVPLAAPTSGASSGCATVDQELIKDIIQNPEDYYVNVHTVAFPAGAIRGQLSR
jgi:hypothetical protein